MRARRLLSHAAVALSGLLCTGSVIVLVLSRDIAIPADEYWSFRGSPVPAVMALAVVGWVITQQRPSHAVGWVFLVAGIAGALDVATKEYAVYAFRVHDGALPGALAAAWASDWTWAPLLAAVGIYLPLLFPNGRFLSRPWRIVAWIAPVGVVTMVLMSGLSPGPLPIAGVSNPLGVEAPWLVSLELVGFTLTASFLAAAVSLVLRFRRSRGDERQQIKWLVYAIVPVPPTSIAGTLVPGDVGRVFQFLLVVTVCGTAVAAAVAVLRHRLYDIDRLINRTVVYAVVTMLLAAVYAAATVAFAPLTGDSPVVVAAATLACAAAFGPVRRRVQSAVDRRFNRSRYDAARTLDAFGTRLREQVELDTLLAELDPTVAATMQPERVSVWLPERT